MAQGFLPTNTLSCWRNWLLRLANKAELSTKDTINSKLYMPLWWDSLFEKTGMIQTLTIIFKRLTWIYIHHWMCATSPKTTIMRCIVLCSIMAEYDYLIASKWQPSITRRTQTRWTLTTTSLSINETILQALAIVKSHT